MRNLIGIRIVAVVLIGGFIFRGPSAATPATSRSAMLRPADDHRDGRDVSITPATRPTAASLLRRQSSAGV
jgi:hypothetical protein